MIRLNSVFYVTSTHECIGCSVFNHKTDKIYIKCHKYYSTLGHQQNFDIIIFRHPDFVTGDFSTPKMYESTESEERTPK